MRSDKSDDGKTVALANLLPGEKPTATLVEYQRKLLEDIAKFFDKADGDEFSAVEDAIGSTVRALEADILASPPKK